MPSEIRALNPNKINRHLIKTKAPSPQAFSSSLHTMVYKVLAISGSLKKASTNTDLLRACRELKNENLQIQILDISQFPHLDTDLISKQGQFSKPVATARDKAEQADALLFAIPEYNYLVSAPLKNAYDWLSMPAGDKPSPIAGKPAGMISSGGRYGGGLAQDHMVNIVQYCKIKLMRQPTIQIKRFDPGMFDENGNLVNSLEKENLKKYLENFVLHIRKSLN